MVDVSIFAVITYVPVVLVITLALIGKLASPRTVGLHNQAFAYKVKKIYRFLDLKNLFKPIVVLSMKPNRQKLWFSIL